MSGPKSTTPASPSLADDLHQAAWLLAPVRGKSARPAPLALLLLGAIWIAVERLRQAVQASASADNWQSSNSATLTKGKELGIDARPGESMPDYRARIFAVQKAKGLA